MTAADRFTHGGHVEAAAREAGIVAEDILDFSANLNPEGLPARAAARLARDATDTRLLARYPDPDARELRQALARRLDVPMKCIVVGAGADALIHTAIRHLVPRLCIIPIPAFAEYEHACTVSGVAVCRIPLRAEDGFAVPVEVCREIAPGDTIVLNNPHNPTGVCVSRAGMLERIVAATSRGATVLVDEAFVDYTPEAAITREAVNWSGIISIRSLTKFYGCGGLRVGYLIASPETACELRSDLPPWPVTALAANALAEAVADDEYARQTLENNRRQRASLVAGLSGVGCRVFPGAANFLLFELPAGWSSSEVRRRLLRTHAILVRNCDSFDGLAPGRYVRVAVRHEKENAHLVAALAEILESHNVS